MSKHSVEEITAALATFVDSGSADGREDLRRACRKMIPQFSSWHSDRAECVRVLAELRVATRSWRTLASSDWNRLMDSIDALLARLTANPTGTTLTDALRAGAERKET